MRIVLAVDGSTHSRATTAFIGRLPLPESTEVTVTTVIDDPARLGIPDPTGTDKLAEIRELMRRSAVELVAETSAALKGRGLTVAERLLEGHPAREIPRLAEELDADIVAVGSRGLGGVERFLLGSVSEKVLQHAPCSCLIGRWEESGGGAAPAASGSGRALDVILALDRSESARAALDMLLSWPLRDRARVAVVSVLELITAYRMDIRERLSPLWRQERADTKTFLEEAATALRGVTAEVDTELREGSDAAEEILEIASARGADLIVAGYRGTNCIERFVLGSTSERLARHAPCSVLVVRERRELQAD